MYDDLVAALRVCVDDDKDCLDCPYYSKCIGNDSDEHKAMVDAADAIEKLGNWWALVDKLMKMLEMPRWIPVSERLPEKYENIIVANKSGKHYDIDNGWWNGSFFDSCAEDGYHSVTHWMPLPEPPEEE